MSLSCIARSSATLLSVAFLAASLTPSLVAQERAGTAKSSDPDQLRDAQIRQFNQSLADRTAKPDSNEYRIGPGDLLDISVLEASELNRSLRVSASGDISMPPLGLVRAAQLSPQELEAALAELLRRSIMQDPHVSVFVHEMESHPVSVTGAVKKPGVFYIRGPKTVLEMLSMAEGLADDAGNSILVMRGAGSPTAGTPPPPENNATEATGTPKGETRPSTEAPESAATNSSTINLNVKDVLGSTDSRYNVPVYPGDIVKVTRAGIVYVLGDVKKPGGFVLQNNESITVLQALAMAEGFMPTAAKSQARIIRTDDGTGTRSEITLDLDKAEKGKIPDPMLQAKDILFVPKSGGKGAFFRSAEILTGTVPSALIYGRF